MKTEKQILGTWGEQVASQWLVKNGYTIITNNYSCPPGEIDIVASKDSVLSFIEVKTRRGYPGSAERAVGFFKQDHLLRAAKYYCRQWNIDLLSTSIQFEQISIYCSPKDKKVQISKYFLPVGMEKRGRHFAWQKPQGLLILG